MGVDSSVMEVRMRLRGARQVLTESKAVSKGIAGVGTAAAAAGATASTTGAKGISKFQRGMSSLRGVSGKVGMAVESGLLRAAGALETFGNKADMLKKKGAAIRSTGRSMVMGITVPLAAMGFMVIKTAAEFDKSMAQVGIALDITGDKLQKMRDLAMEMGAKTIFSANEAAEAILNLAKAGMTEAQIRGGALTATMNLSAAGGMALAQSANLVGASMNTFALKASKATAIADALAGAANASSADLNDMALGFQMAGQSAQMSGLSIFETAGALAAMADQGLRGSDAGTSLKTFLLRLNPVTKKSKELMSELGLNFFDANGEMVGMTKVSSKLRDALGGMNQKQRNAALATLFGADAVRAANIMYNAGPKGIEKYTKATEEKGAAEKMANAQMKGLPGAIEKLKGSLETAALAAGKALAPAVILVAGVIEKAANAFTMLPKPAQTVIVTLLALAAIAGPLVWVVGGLVTGFGLLATGAGMLSGALLFLAANPIVLAIAAVALLAIAFYIAYKRVTWFRRGVDSVVNFIRKFWPVTASILMLIGGPILAIVLLWDKLKNAAVNAVNWIKGAWTKMTAFFSSSPIGKLIAAPFIWAWNKIKAIVAAIVDKVEWMVDKVTSATNVIGDIGGVVGIGGDDSIIGSVTTAPGLGGGPVLPGIKGPVGGGGRERKMSPTTRTLPRIPGGDGLVLEVGSGGPKTLELTEVIVLDGKEVGRKFTKRALDGEARK